MLNSIPKVPQPLNEPVLGYGPGSPEKKALKRALETMSKAPVEIPLLVGGDRRKGSGSADVHSPHAHKKVIAKVAQAGAADVQQAINAALAAQKSWASTPIHERLAIFLRAAELLATKYRPILNAATMLGQSKTAHQAEIDAACELTDFLRFNVEYITRIYSEQPQSSQGVWNTRWSFAETAENPQSLAVSTVARSRCRDSGASPNRISGR